MSFSDHLRKLAQPIWNAQLTHPFVVALGKGTLPERKFKYYILQDARFLGDLARVFSAGAMMNPSTCLSTRAFINFHDFWALSSELPKITV